MLAILITIFFNSSCILKNLPEGKTEFVLVF